MIIILGLGNPGPRYLPTRHNVGFQTVDRLSGRLKIPLYKVGCHAYYGRGSLSGQEVVLAKPLTFMNGSGLAATALCRAFGVPAARLLAVYDDMDLPVGTIRLRNGGGSGGHNGVKSIIYHLETDAFPRLRIGIGRPRDEDVVDYVLQEFSPQDKITLDSVLDTAVDAALVFMREGIVPAMNRYNKKSGLPGQSGEGT